MASQKTGLILLLCGISVISGRNAGQVVRTPDGYLVSKTPATWKEAFVFCAQNGMDLVSITSADEFAAVIEALLSSKINQRGFWTSGTRFGNGGNAFVWFSTGKPVVFSAFANGQPDNYNNNEDCIEVLSYSKPGTWEWNDYPCTERRGFICQERIC
ncbi:lectin subunit alpha [Dendroctonus ponderosae]